MFGKFKRLGAGQQSGSEEASTPAASHPSEEGRGTDDRLKQSVARGTAEGVARSLTQKVWESIFGD
ncbi:hypothetical protein ACWC3Y_12015 [Streptomyces sp. NPDC001296]